MGGARQHFHPQPTDYESAFYRALTWGDKSTTDWLRLLPAKGEALPRWAILSPPGTAPPPAQPVEGAGPRDSCTQLWRSQCLSCWLGCLTDFEQPSRNRDRLLHELGIATSTPSFLASIPSELNRGLRP